MRSTRTASGHGRRLGDSAAAARRDGDQPGEQRRDEREPGDALQQVAPLLVRELVCDEEADLVGRDASAEQRVPEDDAARRAQPGHLGVERRRPLGCAQHLDVDVADSGTVRERTYLRRRAHGRAAGRAAARGRAAAGARRRSRPPASTTAPGIHQRSPKRRASAIASRSATTATAALANASSQGASSQSRSLCRASPKRAPVPVEREAERQRSRPRDHEHHGEHRNRPDDAPSRDPSSEPRRDRGERGDGEHGRDEGAEDERPRACRVVAGARHAPRVRPRARRPEARDRRGRVVRSSSQAAPSQQCCRHDPERRCASPSSPTFTQTCTPSPRCCATSTPRRPTRCGASATRSGTARGRTSAPTSSASARTCASSATTTWPRSASSTSRRSRRDAAVAARWTAAELTADTRAFLEALEPGDTRAGVSLFHGSAREPVWEYVLTEESALATLERAGTQLALVGHSHVALAIVLRGRRRVRRRPRPRGHDTRPDARAVAPQSRLGRPAPRRRPARRLAAARRRRQVWGISPRPIFRRANAGGAAAGGPSRRARRSALARQLRNGGARMASLTNMETKLAEVIGLAMAAQDATDKVAKLVKDRQLDRPAEDAEARRRPRRRSDGMALASSLRGKKGAIGKEARSVKKKAAKMMSDYLERDSDGLDGFEFLTMAEAGEVGHWARARRDGQVRGQPRNASARLEAPARSSAATSRRRPPPRSSSPARRIRTRAARSRRRAAAAATRRRSSSSSRTRSTSSSRARSTSSRSRRAPAAAGARRRAAAPARRAAARRADPPHRTGAARRPPASSQKRR